MYPCQSYDLVIIHASEPELWVFTFSPKSFDTHCSYTDKVPTWDLSCKSFSCREFKHISVNHARVWEPAERRPLTCHSSACGSVLSVVSVAVVLHAFTSGAQRSVVVHVSPVCFWAANCRQIWTPRGHLLGSLSPFSQQKLQIRLLLSLFLYQTAAAPPPPPPPPPVAPVQPSQSSAYTTAQREPPPAPSSWTSQTSGEGVPVLLNELPKWKMLIQEWI